ncbi:peptidase [Streptomyces sp. NPDC101393]|uniref:peptidase n=1 Tax=Streptomyces sp. NPDC101393 TaxID=3366141 RepID=UPI003825F588
MSTQDQQDHPAPALPGPDSLETLGHLAGPAGAEPTVEPLGVRRTYAIAPGYYVNVRKRPDTSSPVVRQLSPGSRVDIHCQRRGERCSGPYGTTDLWDCIGPGQYVSDAYVRTGSSGLVAPRCTS